MAEQTAHDVVKEALSMGAASSIDATANPSNVAPAGNGQAQFTSENIHTKQDDEANETLQRVHTEVVGDTAVQATPEVNLVSESGDIPIDENDIQAVAADASGGSDTDTSKDLKGSATGHVRSNSVKKPTSFKSVSVTKNFLAKTVTAPVAKLSDKGATGSVSPSAAQQSARPRLVAKSALGGLARTAVTNGTAPDASKVWNKNRRNFNPSPVPWPALTSPATPPPPPRQFTDEELKQQYGIHMATRLQADEAGKESKWADIDDDEEDWAPETVEWMDGTKSSVVPADAHATPPPGDGDKSVPMRNEASADSSERGGTPTPKSGGPVSSKTILKPGVHLQNLTKSSSPARDGSEKSSPASKATAPMPSKNPWATLPPIDKIAPVFPQPPPQPSMAPFRRDPHGFESLPPPPVGPAREIAADDFNRTWMDDRGPRELFDSKSGRYEPVGEMRRGSFRHEHNSRHPAVLQRPTQNDRPAPAEPSAAFQTRSTGGESGNWARRRASSNVSAGSGGRRFSLGRPQDERLDNMSPIRAFAPESPQQQFAIMDAGVSPASAGQGSWPQSSPPYNAAQLAPGTQTSPFPNGEIPDGQLGPPDEDPVLRQQRLMREKQEATRLRKQREREEEAREEAARKERLRLKLEALGPATPSPELKEPKMKEVTVVPSPKQPAVSAISPPPKPPIPTNEGEVAQYGVMKVHQPHPVRKATGGDGILSKKFASDSVYSGEHQPPSSNVTVNSATGAGKRGESHTQVLNSASWKSPSPSAPYNWGNNSTNNSTNVWGPPQHNNRGLGNGTFNNDYNRISNTINQSSTIDRPGPIAPPGAYKSYQSRSSLTEQQPTSTSDTSQLPEHLIPSNLDSFDSPSTNVTEDTMAAAIAPPATSGGGTQQRWTVQSWQEAANGGIQARDAEERRIAQAFREAMLKEQASQPAAKPKFTTVWKQTAMDGTYGKRRVLAVIETDHFVETDKADATTANAAKATAADSKVNSDNLSSTAMAANASQASNASAAASRSSRFFPRQEQSSSTKSDSPPPPGNSSLFDDGAAHPKVNLPTPKAVVKLPPSGVAEQKAVVAMATPQRTGVPAVKTPARAQLDDLLQNWKTTPHKASAAPIASASKAPLDVASKEGAKVALPASVNKDDKQSATSTTDLTSKPMASEILLEEREFASRPAVRLPKATYVNAGLPPVSMKLLNNNRPASGRFVPLAEVESVEIADLFVQEEKGGIVTIYVKLPGDHQRQPFTRRAPPKSRYTDFSNKGRRNFSDRRENVSGNGNGNGSGNGNGNGNPAPNNGRRSTSYRGTGRFNNARGNAKPTGGMSSGPAVVAQ